MPHSPKLLVFIVAYKAEPFISGVIERTSRVLESLPEVSGSILVIDDASTDATAKVAALALAHSSFPWKVYRTLKNSGYGGNQKRGYSYAIAEKFDLVVLLHGDGQYAPESIPTLIAPLLRNEADGVLGSRMLKRGDARKGGMPFYKFCGNIFLTTLQNLLLKTQLAEFHTGLRAWRVSALAQLPFDQNSDGFCFDTEILIQMLDHHYRIAEVPIPTRYGDEPCHVRAVPYTFQVLWATLLSRLQRWNWAKRNCFTYSQPIIHPTPQLQHALAELQEIAAGQP